MNIEQQRAACAKFMGWVRHCARKGFYCEVHLIDGVANEFIPVVRIADYHPDLDTPESREQADKLLHRIDELYGLDVMVQMCKDGRARVVIWEPKQTSWIFVNGYGKWWNSALTAAVAEMKVAKEAKEQSHE